MDETRLAALVDALEEWIRTIVFNGDEPSFRSDEKAPRKAVEAALRELYPR